MTRQEAGLIGGKLLSGRRQEKKRSQLRVTANASTAYRSEGMKVSLSKKRGESEVSTKPMSDRAKKHHREQKKKGGGGRERD